MKIYRIIKKIILLCLILMIVLITIMFLWVFELTIGKEYIPTTKVKFRTYEDFLKKAGGGGFPKEEPESAQDTRYYYYEGYFDDYDAVAFTVNEKDYASLVDWYLDFYKLYDNFSGKRYDDQVLPENFICDEKLDFLMKMTEDDLSEYKIIKYISCQYSDRRYMDGCIGNENTGTIIIFHCIDAYPE